MLAPHPTLTDVSLTVTGLVSTECSVAVSGVGPPRLNIATEAKK